VSGVLTEVPVKLVLATDIGQRGAHLVAMRTLTDLRERVRTTAALYSRDKRHSPQDANPIPTPSPPPPRETRTRRVT